MDLDLNSSPPDDEGGGAEPEEMADLQDDVHGRYSSLDDEARSSIDLNQVPQPDVEDANPG